MNIDKLRQSRNPAQRLVFPLDVPSAQAALDLAYNLSGLVGFFKIGLELYLSEGPSIVKAIRAKAPGSGIFLDLKLHDIPATVSQAIKSIGSLEPDLITIHAQGGLEMMETAVKAAPPETTVLAVTVLTSLEPAKLDELGSEYRRPGLYAARLAHRALSAGCHGLVASGQEVYDLRSRFGAKPLLVIPGIRPDWANVVSDDQKRVESVGNALRGGADLLVIGRPIRQADNPSEAARKILAEIASTLNL
ncbi:MAG: orotidine-5'-phosphate decarboxylase [Deltaproteobacteria bacterium]|jgi:orotidine-5'-phosphate decarboxylase|nr:orotidine-5'-phosphate decarboxylase [Deltaproteobacteria bacterium]